MELTFRQKVFLSRVLNLYLETREPLHYSTIAQQLGLSNSTAYDILRLLEGKGMVSSEYVMSKVTSGPGRSSILFFPTAEAIDLFSRLRETRHKFGERSPVSVLLAAPVSKCSKHTPLQLVTGFLAGLIVTTAVFQGIILLR